MNKSTHVISPDVEFNLLKHGSSYPRMIRAMYEIPSLIITASRIGGFDTLPLVPNQVEVCEGIKNLLTTGSEKNELLMKMAKGARQIHVEVFAKEPTAEDMPNLQLHLNFIAVGGKNTPFFRIEVLIAKTGPSHLLNVWRR